MKKLFLSIVTILVAFCFTTSCSHDTGQINTSTVNGVKKVAVKGYDVVAYFTEKKPVKGSKEFSLKNKGVNWFFASQDNLELFKNDPEKYEPQYGGYCAFGVAVPNKKIDIDPKSWYIEGGKLYLNYSVPTQDIWLSNLEDNIEKGDENWKELKKVKE